MGRVDDALRRRNSDPREGAGVPWASSPWVFGDDEGDDSARTNGAAVRRPEAHVVRGTADHDAPVASHGLGLAAIERLMVSATAIERLVVSKDASQILVEQFRNLVATLEQARQEKPLKSIMVTSALPEDGKSHVALNLALTLSESYQRKVLLIDADLRSPSLDRIFQLPDVGGLGEGLSSPVDTALPLVHVNATLSLLPAGRRQLNPLGGLSSDRMRHIVERVTSQFDWVIVDTPPVGLLADGLVISGMVDAAVLVVRAGVTRFADVEVAIATLGRDRILGVILNATDPSEIHHEYHYRHYYGYRNTTPERK